MSVRVGLSYAGFPFSEPAAFWRWVDACEDSAIDSLWLSDRIVGPQQNVEVVAGLAMMAGRTRRLKFGSNVIVLPTRDPVMLAKQTATIDYLSDGRFLPMFGVGADTAPEFTPMGVNLRARGTRANEMLALMSRLWTEDDVSFEGKQLHYEHLTINPKPKQSPFPVWIGGNSEAAIERTARYGYGWLAGGSSLPSQVAPIIEAIRARSAELGRPVDEDHYGVGFSFRYGSWDDAVVQRSLQGLRARAGDADPRAFLAVGDSDAIIARIEAFHAAGISKFVLRPLAESEDDLIEQSQRLSREVVPYVNQL
jgi:probable F420-dependent oxidoreductase